MTVQKQGRFARLVGWVLVGCWRWWEDNVFVLFLAVGFRGGRRGGRRRRVGNLLLNGRGHLGDLFEIGKPSWGLGIGPELRFHIWVDSTSLVRDTEHNLVGALTDGDLDRWQLSCGGIPLPVLHDEPHGVLEELIQDIFDVVGDVGELCVNVAVEEDLGRRHPSTGLATGVGSEEGGPFDNVPGLDMGVDDSNVSTVGHHVIGRIKVAGEGDVLFRKDTSRDPGPKHLAHKLVDLGRRDMFGALHDTQRQLRDDNEVVVQESLDHLTKGIVLFQRLDLGDLSNPLKGLPVEIIDELDMGVGSDDKGEVLEVADTMGKTDGELRPDIVG